jgi:hypothetical protein
VVQAAATVIAILFAAPDFIDRLVRPTICTGCWDFRGLAFIVWVVFFAPVVLLLLAAAWALRPDRIWPSWLALVVDLAVLGLISYSVLLVVTGNGGTSDYAPPWVQILQALLVLVSDLVSLLFLILLVNTSYGSSDRLLRLTRNVLVAQVLGMVACIALPSPGLSDRLTNAYSSGSAGLAFALWTALLAPAGVVILVAAWRLNRSRTWPLLLPALVNIVLLAFLGLTGFVGFVGRVDPLPKGLGTVQIIVVVVPAVASLVMLATFRPPQLRSTAPGT